jgi:hypothetical protein
MKTETKIHLQQVLFTLLLTAMVIGNSGSVFVMASNERTQALASGDFGGVQDSPEISVTLRNEGFNPAELNIPAGRFLFSVDNRSGVSELVLRLSKSDGTRIREIRISSNRGDWNEMFELAPGKYLLSEANHSNWVCRLIVQSK